jgi:hypothetical protein
MSHSDGIGEVVQLPEIDMADAKPFEGAVQLFARLRFGASIGFGR